jgi:hypothetical protein
LSFASIYFGRTLPTGHVSHLTSGASGINIVHAQKAVGQNDTLGKRVHRFASCAEVSFIYLKSSWNHKIFCQNTMFELWKFTYLTEQSLLSHMIFLGQRIPATAAVKEEGGREQI